MATATPPSASRSWGTRPELVRPPDAPPLLVWRFDPPRTVLSSAPVGGGLGRRSWIVNAQVVPGYARTDLRAHARELTDPLGLDPDHGVVLFTAADVADVRHGADGGVQADVTVGVRIPIWAAAPDDDLGGPAPAGTINVVARLPVTLSDAALVNAVATATEAKTQALLECGVAGTGTATDAVAVVNGPDGSQAVAFGGPRSRWGARLARAVHSAVVEGTRASQARMTDRP